MRIGAVTRDVVAGVVRLAEVVITEVVAEVVKCPEVVTLGTGSSSFGRGESPVGCFVVAEVCCTAAVVCELPLFFSVAAVFVREEEAAAAAEAVVLTVVTAAEVLPAAVVTVVSAVVVVSGSVMSVMPVS